MQSQQQFLAQERILRCSTITELEAEYHAAPLEWRDGLRATYEARHEQLRERKATPSSVRGICSLDDLGNAQRLVARHGANLRYCSEFGWLVWDGRRWRLDDTGSVDRCAQEVVASLAAEADQLAKQATELRAWVAAHLTDTAAVNKLARIEGIQAALGKHAKNSRSHKALEHMVARAAKQLEVVTTTKHLDRHNWLLNVRNGTLDLLSRTFRAHSREDLLLKCSPTDWNPDANCPRWLQFLEEVQPDPEIREFLKRYIGMSLTGVIREHVFVINHGQGRNGKGVFQRILTECIGLDYCQAAPAELFMTKGQGDAHPTEKMVLFGKRLVFVSETEEGKALNVALVKQLSGGDPITARKMRQDFVTFDPTHHILLATNGKPRIKDTGHAIWARIRLIPWDVSFEGREDHGLEMALRGELKGILAWAVEGCYEWQERGLDTPRAILDASAAYRAAEDLIGQFLEESCVFAEHHSIRVSDLRRAYVEWCSRAEVYPASPQIFNAALDVRRIRQSVRSGPGGSERRWLGVMLA